MKYIQSFYPYPVTFSSIGKTIAARNAAGEMKNIVEITEKELEKLQNKEPFFRELLNKKKIRILPKLPASYIPAAQQLNAAHAEADKYKSEAEALRARVAELEAQTAEAEDRGPTEEAPAEETISDGATTDDVDRKKQYEGMTYAELQDACKYAGIEYKNKKKAVLIEELVALNK